MTLVLPHSWEKASIFDVCEKVTDGSHNPPKASLEGKAMLSAKNIQNGKILFSETHRLISDADFETENKRTDIQPNDVLLTIVGALGRAAIVQEGLPKFVLQRSVAVLGSNFLETSYFKYALESNEFQKQIIENAKGTAQKGIYLKKLKSLAIAVPPLAEQKVIAEKLDSLLAQVEATKTRLEGIPEILKQFRQSVLAAAVSGELTEDWRDAEDDETDWKTLKLKDISEIKDPHPSHRTPKAVANGVPYIGIGDLKNDGSIDFDNARKVSFDVLKEHNSRYTIKEGDFVFGKIGTLGKATKLPVGEKYTLSANVILIQPLTDKVVPIYLMHFLSAPDTMNEIANQANSTSQAAFGIKKMRAFITSLPTVKEQQEIVHRIEELFTFANKIEAKAKTALENVNHLTQSILAQAFSGELTKEWREQKPDLISGENSAEALLERIKAEREKLKPVKRARKKKA